jgi:F0F1-type ATP synthase membrane subunit b/b'
MKLLVVLLGVVVSRGALAEGAAHHPALWVFVLNFAIFVSLLVYLLKNKVVTGWASYSAQVAEQVTKGERRLEAAKNTFEKLQARNVNLPAEIESITKSIFGAQLDECSRISQEATTLARSMAERTNQVVAQEARAASARLAAELQGLVLEQARALAKSSWGQDQDKALRGKIVQSEKMQGLTH